MIIAMRLICTNTACIPGAEAGGGNIVVSLVLLGRLQRRITEVDNFENDMSDYTYTDILDYPYTP